MFLIYLAGLAFVILILAVCIEAYIKRGRKKRTFVEIFKGDDGEGDEGVPLGMEATDFEVLKEEERKAYHMGMTNQTRTVAKMRKK